VAGVRPARRLDGVDIARGLAIIGMLTRHVGPLPENTDVASAAWFYSRTDGRASVLFVLVAGIGVALLAARRDDQTLRARMIYRAAWLLPLGLWLQSLDHPVAVILQYYALFFLAVLPFVRRRDRTVLAWVATLTVLGPAAILAPRVLRPDLVTRLGGDPALLTELVVFGIYPVVTYLPPMLMGLWLGRRALHDRAVQITMVAVGVTALAVTTAVSVVLAAALGVEPEPTGWSYALTVDGHSEMPLALIGATGIGVAIVGLCLLVADRFPRLLWPATAFGRLALTVYVGHLLVFDLAPGLLESTAVSEGVTTVAAITAIGTSVAVAWLAVLPRGPLEGLERWPFQHLIAPHLGRRT
jgi:uncharacterized membrane protein YeiB